MKWQTKWYRDRSRAAPPSGKRFVSIRARSSTPAATKTDLRVYPTACSQARLDSALSVRPRSAELLCADVHVKEITFNKGYYTVDVTYFYRVRGETFPGCEPVCGLAIFDKRVMLFGSQAKRYLPPTTAAAIRARTACRSAWSNPSTRSPCT